MTQEKVIEVREITKKFDNSIANDHISSETKRGETHVLLGENGTGKSASMNMPAGLLQPTSGGILVKGEATHLDSPSESAKMGIRMVHWHFVLVGAFTVAENIILDNKVTKKGGILNLKEVTEEIEESSEGYDLAVDPSARISDITIGARQRVEILETLYRGAGITIFDGLTAVLAPSEIAELLDIMHNLIKEGESIILITHKLDEIRAIADRITAIHHGRSIQTMPVTDSTSEELAEMMVGRAVSFKAGRIPASPKDIILPIEDLVVNENRGVPAVKELSLDVCAGEIVGIAGIDGNRQNELAEAITGLRKVESGNVIIKGVSMANERPRKTMKLDIGHVPEDRHRDDMVLDMTIAENIALQAYYKEPFSKHGFTNYNKLSEHARELTVKFDVHATNELVAGGALSGSSRQEAVITHETDHNPDLLIINQPVRGLDVGAVEYIRKRLVVECDKGKAVLVISFELDEILDVSNRVAVVRDGKIQGILDATRANRQELGILMAGRKVEKEDANV